MKYAICREMTKNRLSSWTVEPWKLMGLIVYDTISQIPDDAILIASHYAPWWSPLKEWIDEGRPWIEIDYAYWGDKHTTRRITYNGHHNIHINSHPFSRSHLFSTPQIQDWRPSSTNEYVLGILPIESLLLQRTGENLEQFKIRLSKQISQYWDGPVMWRKKIGKNKFYTLQQDIKHAYAVVGERTMACVQSCLLGTPAFTVDNSMTTLLMGGIENLKTISYPDRQNWWEHICWSQFHATEFTTIAPAELTEQYQIEKCI
jgi:hypothetical protein